MTRARTTRWWRPRSLRRRDNLEARIIVAKREGWLGEVEGLQVSYSVVNDKLAQNAR